ncbi:MAG: hypothetical protein K1Y01_08390 [Vicinamibacteria bacterium]|nr:hypothetical protein [Vicinamibacteria bacterium]
MNTRALLTLGLLSLTASTLCAQAVSEFPLPVTAPAPRAPKAPKAPKAASVPTPPLPASAGILDVPDTPSILEVPQAPTAPKAAPAPATAPAPAVAPLPPRPPAQLLNVQIEVTLSDSKGAPKTVVLTVADGEMGQNRTNSSVQVGSRYENYSFNADGKPSISGNKIRLYLSAEANVPASPDANAGTSGQITLRQSQTLILNDGDSVEIARATDPVTARAFSLSVKVKIQR